MVKKGSSSVFQGKQGYMYAVALLAWANYTGYQGDFATLNSKYTKAFAEEQQAAIEAARTQPNVKQRRDVPKQARNETNKAATALRAIWQLLSSLIENSFSEDQQDLMKSVAGSNYYLKSSDDNWPATFDMGDAAAAFITEYEEALTAGGMLPTFPPQFAGVKKTYDGLYGTYYTTKQNAKDGTKKKRSSNAAVYKTTLSMMKDGVKLFRDNPDVREKFVYTSLMKIVSGKGFIKTGYLFICKEAATGLPVSKAEVVFTAADGTSYTGKMGKKGNLRCEMPAGNYDYVLKSPGYTTVIGTVKAIEGSERRKTLKLVQDTGNSFLPQQSKVV